MLILYELQKLWLVIGRLKFRYWDRSNFAGHVLGHRVYSRSYAIFPKWSVIGTFTLHGNLLTSFSLNIKARTEQFTLFLRSQRSQFHVPNESLSVSNI